MPSPDVLEWYRFAKMDMEAAITLNEHSHPRPLEIICYHAQQCAEKMLKGFLVSNGIAPPKKHDLPLLCDMCVEVDSRFKELHDISDFLTVFGVQPRYPDELTVLDEDADKALLDIQKIMDFYKVSCIIPE
jgi:HEPN domain-containing protein